MSKKTKIQLAREFRKNPTKSERIMWQAIRNRQFLNLKFRRQYLVEGYLVDFYCHELKLAIEIDGSIHRYEDRLINDIERQKIIETKGIKFFRISDEEVEYDVTIVLKKLESYLKELNKTV